MKKAEDFATTESGEEERFFITDQTCSPSKIKSKETG
jgi:hypothetical protein